MNITWLPVAARDLEAQVEYIAERNVYAAIRLGDAVDAAVQNLISYPEIGRLGRIPGTRELVVSSTPYIVAYRVEPDAVVILRVLHGAQRWPKRM